MTNSVLFHTPGMPDNMFYAPDDARYLRWRQARQTRYWVIDRYWYQLLGQLGKDCVHESVHERFDIVTTDLYGRFNRSLLLDMAPRTLLIESGE